VAGCRPSASGSSVADCDGRDPDEPIGRAAFRRAGGASCIDGEIGGPIPAFLETAMSSADVTLETPSPQAFFASALAARGSAERAAIARTKRAVELYTADAKLRAAIAAEPERTGDLLRAAGAPEGIDHDGLRYLFDEELLRREPVESAPEHVRLYRAWVGDLKRLRELMRRHAMSANDPRFRRWQARQIARCDSELPGGTAEAIVHPTFAFELASGCSVGCWFCGVSAEEFRGALAYTPQERQRWRGMLESVARRFGPAAQTGFCYWATDPVDTPDYDRFVADYYEINGYLPQTTTAAPLKDEALTRRILTLAGDASCMANRFSILTPRQLKAVHAAFTPEELLTVELVIQTKESLVAKAEAGRMRERKARQMAERSGGKLTERELDGGTIACVTGFLVNVPEGTLRLISPCTPTSRWPLGYRVYAEGRFETAEEFDALLEDTMQRAMPAAPARGERIAFRRDLTFVPDGETRFRLSNRHRTHTIEGPAFVGRLGAALVDGGTPGEMLGAALEAGGDVFAATTAIQEFFDSGYIEAPVETVRLTGPAEPAHERLLEAGE
jgi:radical SAM family RiPP maturation amino acid epimerase